LAAFLLGALNVFPLMSLESQPAAGYSPTIRELRTNLRKFEAVLAANGLPIHASWDLPQFSSPPPAAGGSTGNHPSTQATADPHDRASTPVALPDLSGIIRTLESDGSVRFRAVFNGRGYRENDTLDDFTVHRITPAGVVLQHAHRTWFIQCPSPFYSSDQGE
jgi:hypothetical protein